MPQRLSVNFSEVPRRRSSDHKEWWGLWVSENISIATKIKSIISIAVSAVINVSQECNNLRLWNVESARAMLQISITQLLMNVPSNQLIYSWNTHICHRFATYLHWKTYTQNKKLYTEKFLENYTVIYDA